MYGEEGEHTPEYSWRKVMDSVAKEGDNLGMTIWVSLWLSLVKDTDLVGRTRL